MSREGERWPADAQAEGAWISLPDNGKGYPVHVGDLVPTGFETTVRIFNSIRLGTRLDFRWAEVAALHGRTFHQKVLLHDVFPLPAPGDPPDVHGWSCAPSPRQWEAIGRVLRRHTSSDTFFVGMWIGSGLPKEADEQKLLRLPHREYSVVEVRFDKWTVIDHLRHQLINIVWPRDRSWLLHSDIDSPETYVAASAAAAEDLLGDEELEAALADRHDRLALY